MSTHLVTADWEPNGGPSMSLKCEAPAEALCHAVWACECEEWDEDGVEDGKPWHRHDGDSHLARHRGKFDPTECNLRDWFENSDEPMEGAIVFRVDPVFHGDYVTFKPAGAVLV